jgi:N-acetylglucosamine kinase-like BadF-type ATPase
MDLVLGVDAGGTASRAVLATLDGRVLGRGLAGPGNPVTATSPAAASIRTAIRQAIGEHSPSEVVAAVLGVAGVADASDPAAAVFRPMWSDLALSCPFSVVGDVVTAFAAGSPSPSGTVLIAGTGAIAARVTDLRVTATADGLGWLLGDEGSGRWIGLQAVRAAVRDWSSPLGQLVAARSGAASAAEAVRWAQTLPFAEIGALTPPVCAAARSGSPAATRIITAAVDHLIVTLDSLAAQDPLIAREPLTDRQPLAGFLPVDLVAPEPVVLAGGLLVADTPVRDGVLAVLAKREVPTGTARDPAAAAAWLAARALSRRPPGSLHAALLPA